MGRNFLFAVLLSCLAGCAHYQINEGKSGESNVIYTKGNLLENRGGSGLVFFDLVKYTDANGDFYGAVITYVYDGSFFKTFHLRKEGGIMLTFNDENRNYIPYKKPPVHTSNETASWAGGIWLRSGMSGDIIYLPGFFMGAGFNSTETVECLLTESMLAKLMKNDRISVTLTAETGNDGQPVFQEAAFSRDNLDTIKKIYDEQIKHNAVGMN